MSVKMTSECTVTVDVATGGDWYATGNTEITGTIISGKKEIVCKGDEICTLPSVDCYAVTDVAIGGAYTGSIQATYRDGYGDWQRIVRIPAKTAFKVCVIDSGSIESAGEIKVSVEKARFVYRPL